MYKDMKGSKCTHCQQGTYVPSTDSDSLAHCTGCGRQVQRWQAPAQRIWETYPGEDTTDFDDRYDR